jgi:hypothetical protein
MGKIALRPIAAPKWGKKNRQTSGARTTEIQSGQSVGGACAGPEPTALMQPCLCLVLSPQRSDSAASQDARMPIPAEPARPDVRRQLDP